MLSTKTLWVVEIVKEIFGSHFPHVGRSNVLVGTIGHEVV
jgi:hypothetical protein